MTPWIERLYHRAPVPLQNIGVSLYGLKLYRERYGKGARSYLDQLLKSQYFSEDEMRALQEERFVELARDAIETVPHYRDWARSTGLAPNDIRSLDDLSLFPILEKETLRENPERLISERFPRRSLIELGTSGTSGTPLRIFTDKSARTHHYAFFSRLRSWYGLSERSRRATLFGRVIQNALDGRPPFWRHDLSQNNLLMSSYHLAEANMPHYYEALKRYKPSEIIGYPSSLYPIARYIVDNERDPINVAVVFSTAETLLPYQREALEQAFNAPVCNQYGCAEMAFFGSECISGAMHLHPEHGLAEILCRDDQTLGMNGSGEMIATGLLNLAMPLIRYRIGDTVTIQSGACTCGLPFRRLEALEGRTDDTIRTHSGAPVGRLGPVFRSDKAVTDAQVIQHTTGAITVKVIPTAYHQTEHTDMIRNEIRNRVGPELDINVSIVDSIAKEANGKLRSVISHYKPAQRYGVPK